jgi:hypothetical protein
VRCDVTLQKGKKARGGLGRAPRAFELARFLRFLDFGRPGGTNRRSHTPNLRG